MAASWAMRDKAGATGVERFATIRDAKDYLAGRIAAEAKRQGTALTDVERKMLYFSETDWTLPDMKAVSAEFDRDCDQDEYERKIGGLARRIQARDAQEKGQEQQDWDEAVVKLSEGDHYLTVLVNLPAQPIPKSPWVPQLEGASERPPGDMGRLILVALVSVFVFLGAALLLARH